MCDICLNFINDSGIELIFVVVNVEINASIIICHFSLKFLKIRNYLNSLTWNLANLFFIVLFITFSCGLCKEVIDCVVFIKICPGLTFLDAIFWPFSTFWDWMESLEAVYVFHVRLQICFWKTLLVPAPGRLCLFPELFIYYGMKNIPLTSTLDSL